MRMVGCGDGSDLNMPADSLNGRKLRPLIPKPPTASPNNTTHSAVTTPIYWSCNCSKDIFAVNHHLATQTEQTKTDMINSEPLVSSRWNPTPEQINALEELYRGGTRTPTAEQIQQIAAKLRQFGKIEGKNVFYWFQNHKARERQKRRRPILDSGYEEQLCHLGSLEGKQSDLSRADFDIQQKKNWAAPSNCSKSSEMINKGTLEELSRAGFDIQQKKNWAAPSNCSKSSKEYCASIHRAAVSDSRGADGWTQFQERELQQISSSNSLRAKHATSWQMTGMPCTPPPSYLSNTIAIKAAPQVLGITDPKLSTNTQDLNTETINIANFNEQYESRESQTLQLFPVQKDDPNVISDSENIHQEPITTTNVNFTPNQFIEFL